MPKDIIRVIEPLWTEVYKDAEQRLKFLTRAVLDSEKRSYYTEVTFDNLIDCFRQHNKNDVPPFNEHTFDELIKALNKGKRVYQYHIHWVPNYYKIDGELWIYEKKVAEIKGSLRTLYNLRRSGKLTSRSVNLYNEVNSCRRTYIRPDKNLFYWCTDIEDPTFLLTRFSLAKHIVNTGLPGTINELYSLIEQYERSHQHYVEGIGVSKAVADRSSVSLYFEKLLGEITLTEFSKLMKDTRLMVKLVQDSITSLYGEITPPEDFVDNLCFAVGLTRQQYESIDVNDGLPGDIGDTKLRNLLSILLKLEEESTLTKLGLK